jgi:hypothetical protein
LADPPTAWRPDEDHGRRSVRVGRERLRYVIYGLRLKAGGEARVASEGALELLEDGTAAESVNDDVT